MLTRAEYEEIMDAVAASRKTLLDFCDAVNERGDIAAASEADTIAYTRAVTLLIRQVSSWE